MGGEPNRFAAGKIAAALCAGLFLSGAMCVSPRATTDTFCLNYKPIRASRSDTAETLRQIKGQNAVYDALCKAAPAFPSPSLK